MALTWGRGTMISLIGPGADVQDPGDHPLAQGGQAPDARAEQDPDLLLAQVPGRALSDRPRAEGKRSRDRNEKTRTSGLKTAMRKRMG